MAELQSNRENRVDRRRRRGSFHIGEGSKKV